MIPNGGRVYIYICMCVCMCVYVCVCVKTIVGNSKCVFCLMPSNVNPNHYGPSYFLSQKEDDLNSGEYPPKKKRRMQWAKLWAC